MDSAVHRINHYPADNTSKTNWVIQWIVIYPVDSAIQRLNNWSQVDCWPVVIKWLSTFSVTSLQGYFKLCKLTYVTLPGEGGYMNHPWVSCGAKIFPGEAPALAKVLKIERSLAPVVQTLDSAIHWINHYPLDNSIGFASVYPLDSDLSGGQRYPSFEQLGPDH